MSNCLNCLFCLHSSRAPGEDDCEGGNQDPTDCKIGVLATVPTHLKVWTEHREKVVEDGVTTDGEVVSGFHIKCGCHSFLPVAAGDQFGVDELGPILERKRHQHIDYYIFEFGDDAALESTFLSACRQIHQPRKIVVGSCGGGVNPTRVRRLYQYLPKGTLVEHKSSILPIERENLPSSNFLYECLNGSVKLGQGNPPRPHFISLATAGYVWDDNHAASIQKSVLEFRPFLVIRPAEGLDGLVMSRRFYAGINGANSLSIVDKIKEAESLQGDVKLFYQFIGD